MFAQKSDVHRNRTQLGSGFWVSVSGSRFLCFLLQTWESPVRYPNKVVTIVALNDKFGCGHIQIVFHLQNR